MISTPYEIDNRSDYAGFRTRRIPATGLYTGAETPKTAAMAAQYGGQASIQADPCYHEWCDTVFNLSEFGLNEFTDALAHGVLSFAGVGNDAVETSVRPEMPDRRCRRRRRHRPAAGLLVALRRPAARARRPAARPRRDCARRACGRSTRRAA